MQSTDDTRRDLRERTRDTRARLDRERDVWVSTAHPERGPHQVPLWFWWDGRALWLCTGGTTATARNLRADPRVRLALPDTFDVVQLRGTADCFPAAEVPEEGAAGFAAKFGWDPRTAEGPYVYLRVAPDSVLAWRGEGELPGRVLMRAGVWLG
ncbi:Pyridoxamine 5'-phosphate oxidase [Streptomyces sp. YIM 121038]|uniref:pyridoxamine 5'-phosphate oxidase family protein n=1 Tax=Streptomyces sp. YIM 121038 TaxID=2136401 RepID=UPI0011103210|nr:pyridoxamine 5'-phosphate oxidase family protein [Streptomyces sp. YIM 121038]QCX74262.1 Pyridoxamine 5'-phosphate oxidase [Streptomyces sp. YIM 121038]